MKVSSGRPCALGSRCGGTGTWSSGPRHRCWGRRTPRADSRPPSPILFGRERFGDRVPRPGSPGFRLELTHLEVGRGAPVVRCSRSWPGPNREGLESVFPTSDLQRPQMGVSPNSPMTSSSWRRRSRGRRRVRRRRMLRCRRRGCTTPAFVIARPRRVPGNRQRTGGEQSPYGRGSVQAAAKRPPDRPPPRWCLRVPAAVKPTWSERATPA
jgi:hypothetical protein